MVKIDINQPRFLIIHANAEFAGQCLPGEECIAIILIWRGKWYWIPWGPTHLILADFLCRHRGIALDAWQISAKMAEDPFVQQHGMNLHEDGRPARTNRVSVRQQMKRLRDTLRQLLKEEHLDLDASTIIRAERTSSGTVKYRIAVGVSWEHWTCRQLTDDRVPRIDPGMFGTNRPSGEGLPL